MKSKTPCFVLVGLALLLAAPDGVAQNYDWSEVTRPSWGLFWRERNPRRVLSGRALESALNGPPVIRWRS